MRLSTRTIAPAAVVTACLFCLSVADAKKPDKPPGGGGGGGDSAAYTLIDLLGFDNDGLGYQSRARFITNRDVDGGDVLVHGISYLRFPGLPSIQHPATWFVDSDGNFPEPIDLGLPSFAKEVEPIGFNHDGISVGWTRGAVEKDGNDDWVFPGYVHALGFGYQELPWVASRDTTANAINDSGMVVGEYAIEDASSTNGLKYVGGLWQLNPDGTISDPVSLGDFRPWKINNAGVIAGHYQGNPTIAWYQGEVLTMQQLVGSSRFFAADVHAMNDFAIDDPRLSIVGTSTFNEAGQYDALDSRRGYAWRPFDTASPTTVLGTLGGNESTALDVNRHGAIVGYSDTRRKGQQAFVYTGGVMKNLNTQLDVGSRTLQWAEGINDDGDIVGFMKIPRPVSEQRGFLLRPITTN